MRKPKAQPGVRLNLNCQSNLNKSLTDLIKMIEISGFFPGKTRNKILM